MSAVRAEDPPSRDTPDSDYLLIQGDWVVTHNEIETLVSKEMQGSRFTFEGERFRINGEPAGEQFILGARGGRKTIDFKHGPSMIMGIYKLEGDRLTLCTAPPRTPRPSRFETSVGSGVILTVLERDD